MKEKPLEKRVRSAEFKDRVMWDMDSWALYEFITKSLKPDLRKGGKHCLFSSRVLGKPVRITIERGD